MAVKPIPDGYRTLTPYLVVKDVDELIDFLIRTFEAKINLRMKGKEGKTHHAELTIGDSMVMLGRARNDDEITPGMLFMYTKDTDTLYKKAVQEGATSLMEPSNQFYGDRNAGIRDPLGNTWWIATHVEDVSPEEMERRMNEQGH